MHVYFFPYHLRIMNKLLDLVPCASFLPSHHHRAIIPPTPNFLCFSAPEQPVFFVFFSLAYMEIRRLSPHKQPLPFGK